MAISKELEQHIKRLNSTIQELKEGIVRDSQTASKPKSRKRGDDISTHETAIGTFRVNAQRGRGSELPFDATVDAIEDHRVKKAEHFKRPLGKFKAIKPAHRTDTNPEQKQKNYIIASNHENSDFIRISNDQENEVFGHRLLDREAVAYTLPSRIHTGHRGHLITENLGQDLCTTPRTDSKPHFRLNTLLKELITLHTYGLIHRDIKPGNLLRNDKKQLHLIDFGFLISRGAKQYSISGTITYVDWLFYKRKAPPHFGCDYWPLLVTLARALPPKYTSIKTKEITVKGENIDKPFKIKRRLHNDAFWNTPEAKLIAKVIDILSMHCQTTLINKKHLFASNSLIFIKLTMLAKNAFELDEYKNACYRALFRFYLNTKPKDKENPFDDIIDTIAKSITACKTHQDATLLFKLMSHLEEIDIALHNTKATLKQQKHDCSHALYQITKALGANHAQVIDFKNALGRARTHTALTKIIIDYLTGYTIATTAHIPLEVKDSDTEDHTQNLNTAGSEEAKPKTNFAPPTAQNRRQHQNGAQTLSTIEEGVPTEAEAEAEATQLENDKAAIILFAKQLSDFAANSDAPSAHIKAQALNKIATQLEQASYTNERALYKLLEKALCEIATCAHHRRGFFEANTFKAFKGCYQHRFCCSFFSKHRAQINMPSFESRKLNIIYKKLCHSKDQVFYYRYFERTEASTKGFKMLSQKKACRYDELLKQYNITISKPASQSYRFHTVV